MKKSKKILLGLLAASVGLLAVFLIFEHVTLDRTAPEITCPETTLETSVAVTEKELLADVTARDDRDGDLTSAVVVESLSAMGRDHSRTVTYAVMDLEGNVGRASRSIRYTDYQLPRIQLSAPLRIAKLEQLFPLLDGLQVTSSIDGDLSGKLKYTFTDGGDISVGGTHSVELRVSDSTGSSTIIPTTLEIYNGAQETIRVQLKQYILYLPVNSQFDPESFYLSASKPGRMTCTSNVDTSVPGVYHVNYLVENKGSGEYGKSTLIVVVEE